MSEGGMTEAGQASSAFRMHSLSYAAGAGLQGFPWVPSAWLGPRSGGGGRHARSQVKRRNKMAA